MIEKFNPKLNYQTNPFTSIPNVVIQNIDNAEAFLVWSYLQSKPQKWKVVKSHLKTKFGYGKKKIIKIFSYLNKAKLIEYIQLRDDQGRMLPIHEITVLNGLDFTTPTAPTETDPAVKTAPTQNGVSGKEPPIKKRQTINKKDLKSLPHSEAIANFETFYSLYPKKTDKKKALAKWLKMKPSPELCDLILSDVERRKRDHRKWIEGYANSPLVYLNGELWNDEIDLTRKVTYVSTTERRHTAINNMFQGFEPYQSNNVSQLA